MVKSFCFDHGQNRFGHADDSGISQHEFKFSFSNLYFFKQSIKAGNLAKKSKHIPDKPKGKDCKNLIMKIVKPFLLMNLFKC